MAAGKTCDTVDTIVLRIDADLDCRAGARSARSRTTCPPMPRRHPGLAELAPVSSGTILWGPRR
jgi:hypothetical protein